MPRVASFRWRALAAALVVSCVDRAGRRPPTQRAADLDAAVVTLAPRSPAGACIDHDGDTFGTDCAAGPDCDDADPARTDACYACLRPSEGCACDGSEAPVPCNRATGTTALSPEGVCHLGQRVCRGGAWSACESFAGAGARVIGAASACYGQCDPTCRHFVDCIDASDSLPADARNVSIANLAPLALCPSGAGAGGVQPACEPRAGGAYQRAPSTLAWIDACAEQGAQVVLAGADEGSAAVALPFPFTYWGVGYRSVNVYANGLAQFASSAASWENTTLPSPSTPDAVFAFWDDLALRGGVCVAAVGAAPARRFVMQWNDAGFYPRPDDATHLTFELVLSEATQSLDVLYRRMEGPTDRATGASATVGLQAHDPAGYDLAGYDTAGVAAADSGYRWSPESVSRSCAQGVYRRRFEATCPGDALAVPTWSMLYYGARVPDGADLRLELRVARSAAALADARPIPLPGTPQTAGPDPVTTGFDLGQLLATIDGDATHAPFVELTAHLDPGADADLAPALGSLELQYHCAPFEAVSHCVAGNACVPATPCRSGAVVCTSPRTSACAESGPLPVGVSCGPQAVCDAEGACVACDEGARCDTGNPCIAGRIRCDTGAPVCEPVRPLPSGAVCELARAAYTRDASPLAFVDVCGRVGAATYLPSLDDGADEVVLPFPFNFYDRTHTKVGLSVNGALGFPSVPPLWENAPIPSAAMGDAVFAFWDDVATRAPGICVATLGREPARYFVAQWSDVDLQSELDRRRTGASLSFEVVLEESAQAIHVLYAGDGSGSASRLTGASATIGIQRGDGASYDAFAYNESGAARADAAIRWSPAAASVCDGEGACVRCDARERCDGRDNTCDGRVDEGFDALSCGVGACARAVPGCDHGAPGVCTPGEPATEVCNGVDDDCDGLVDDDCHG